MTTSFDRQSKIEHLVANAFYENRWNYATSPEEYAGDVPFGYSEYRFDDNLNAHNRHQSTRARVTIHFFSGPRKRSEGFKALDQISETLLKSLSFDRVTNQYRGPDAGWHTVANLDVEVIP